MCQHIRSKIDMITTKGIQSPFLMLMPIFDKKPNGKRSPIIGEGERKREMEEVKVK